MVTKFWVSSNTKTDHKMSTNNPYLYRFFCRKLKSYHNIWYSEFHDICSDHLPLLHYDDIIRMEENVMFSSEQNGENLMISLEIDLVITAIVNKRGLTRFFVISKFGCNSFKYNMTYTLHWQATRWVPNHLQYPNENSWITIKVPKSYLIELCSTLVLWFGKVMKRKPEPTRSISIYHMSPNKKMKDRLYYYLWDCTKKIVYQAQ